MPRPPSALSWFVTSLVIAAIVVALGASLTEVAWPWWGGGGFAGGAIASWVVLHASHKAAVRAFEAPHREHRMRELERDLADRFEPPEH